MTADMRSTVDLNLGMALKVLLKRHTAQRVHQKKLFPASLVAQAASPLVTSLASVSFEHVVVLLLQYIEIYMKLSYPVQHDRL